MFVPLICQLKEKYYEYIQSKHESMESDPIDSIDSVMGTTPSMAADH
jgi:hypothetical protein